LEFFCLKKKGGPARVVLKRKAASSQAGLTRDLG